MKANLFVIAIIITFALGCANEFSGSYDIQDKETDTEKNDLSKIYPDEAGDHTDFQKNDDAWDCSDNRDCDEGWICGYGNICVEKKEYLWSEISPDKMSHYDAEKYCEEMGEKWKLPDINQLRSIIINCPQVEYPRPLGQEKWCLASEPYHLDWNTGWGEDFESPCSGCEHDYNGNYSVLGDTEFLWSSSLIANNNLDAWVVFFGDGTVYRLTRSHSYYFRCIKSE